MGEEPRGPVGAVRADGVEFRVCAGADVAAVVELVNSAYRGEESRRGWTTEADLLGGQRVDAEGVSAIVDDPDARIMLTESWGRLVACCELRGAGAGAGYFGLFSVLPSAQGNGLGRRVLAEAERVAATDLGCRSLRMTVLRQRADLIAWYERRGYRRTGVLSPFPYGDERFGIPKRSDLEFEELVKPIAG